MTEVSPYPSIHAFLRALKPDPVLTVSEWANAFRMLPSTVAEPGKFRMARTPYNKEIADHLSVTSPVQMIIFKKCSQIGATETGNNWLGYIIDQAPAPTLYVMPTDTMMEVTSKQRIQPMIDATPSLHYKIKPNKAKDSGNTIQYKTFDGGFVKMVGANSPVGLSSTAVRYVYADEVDRYPADVGGEGSAIKLAQTRTVTYGARKKIFITSTPTLEGTSLIDELFKTTGQRYYHVPCPFCGAMQSLVLENLRWEKGLYNREDVKYECAHCHEHIPEYYKTQMLDAGEWIAAKPELEDGKTIGYHLNALYSPYGWYSWAEMAKEYDESENNIPDRITFVNTKQGETFKQKGEVPEWQRLYALREKYQHKTCFKNVAFVTAGVDVQADRLELEIVGWIKGKQSQSIDYRVIVGDTSLPDTWTKLETVLNETYVREDGVFMPISIMCIDTGYNTQHVYSFCKNNLVGGRVIPIKGKDGIATIYNAPQAVHYTRGGQKINDLKVFNIGVSIVKSELYGWLKLVPKDDGSFPDGYCHFPERDADYFKSLVSEKLVRTTDKKGRMKYEWQKQQARNEALDCFCAQTEILTKNGWKFFKDLVYSDELATVNLSTDLIEYQLPQLLIEKEYCGDMVHLKGKRIDILVTPKHRMVTYKKERTSKGWNFNTSPKITLAKDLSIHHQIKTSAKWIGSDLDYEVIPACYSLQGRLISTEKIVCAKIMAAFLGWYVSEGCVFSGRSKTQKNIRYRVEITQCDVLNIEIIKALLNQMPFRYRVEKQANGVKFIITSKQLYTYVLSCGENKYSKRVPQWLKDAKPEIISEFIKSAINGDGWEQQKKKHHAVFRSYCTVSKQLADDMQELILKTGKASNIKIRGTKPYRIRGREGANTVQQYHVTEINRVKASLDSSNGGKRHYLGKKIEYSSYVYCATVPNGTLIVRRNGKAFIAGNCRVYARAAAEIFGMSYLSDEHWAHYHLTIPQATAVKEESAPPPPKKKRDSIW